MTAPEDSHDLLAEPSEVVCPVCLRNNEPEAAFCAVCGAPLGAVAHIDPIQQIHAEGFALRSAASGPPRTLVLVGTWLAMLPIAGGALAMTLGEFPMNLFGLSILLLAVGVLVRTTINYVVRKWRERKAEAGISQS